MSGRRVNLAALVAGEPYKVALTSPSVEFFGTFESLEKGEDSLSASPPFTITFKDVAKESVAAVREKHTDMIQDFLSLDMGTLILRGTRDSLQVYAIPQDMRDAAEGLAAFSKGRGRKSRRRRSRARKTRRRN
jgi:hypothetical protein